MANLHYSSIENRAGVARQSVFHLIGIARTWKLPAAVAMMWLIGSACGMAASPEKIAKRNPVAAINVEAGLAVKGYDVVAYFSDGKPVKGLPRFSTKWNGVTWQFASADHRAAFIREPGKYAPQYGGYCAFGMSQGIAVDIDPQQWKVVDGKLYLNNNPFAQTLWARDPAGHIKEGDANWRIIPRKEN